MSYNSIVRLLVYMSKYNSIRNCRTMVVSAVAVNRTLTVCVLTLCNLVVSQCRRTAFVV